MEAQQFGQAAREHVCLPALLASCSPGVPRVRFVSYRAEGERTIEVESWVASVDLFFLFLIELIEFIVIVVEVVVVILINIDVFDFLIDFIVDFVLFLLLVEVIVDVFFLVFEVVELLFFLSFDFFFLEFLLAGMARIKGWERGRPLIPRCVGGSGVVKGRKR